MGVFSGGLGALGRVLGRDPRWQSALDLAVLSAASLNELDRGTG